MPTPLALGVGARLQRGDQPIHALVDRPERVLAQHGALGLVVELQVHPVDGEVAPGRLRRRDEIAAQLRPRGLRRGVLGQLDLTVVGDPVDQAQRTVLCKDPFRSVDERVDRLIASL